MKKGKRVKPIFPVEYRLLITSRYLEREKSTAVQFMLRTLNEFSNFLYELVVKPSLENHTLQFKIVGLRTPRVTIPGTGPAIFKTEYKNLRGKYEIIISKPDRRKNIFSVKITKSAITIEKAPMKKFAEIVTNVNEW